MGNSKKTILSLSYVWLSVSAVTFRRGSSASPAPRSSTCLSGSSFHTNGFQWTCWLKHPLWCLDAGLAPAALQCWQVDRPLPSPHSWSSERKWVKEKGKRKGLARRWHYGGRWGRAGMNTPFYPTSIPFLSFLFFFVTCSLGQHFCPWERKEIVPIRSKATILPTVGILLWFSLNQIWIEIFVFVRTMGGGGGQSLHANKWLTCSSAVSGLVQWATGSMIEPLQYFTTSTTRNLFHMKSMDQDGDKLVGKSNKE